MSGQNYGLIGFQQHDATFPLISHRSETAAYTPSPRRCTRLHNPVRCHSTKNRLLDHFEESPSESELIIRDIIAKHRPKNVPLSDFKAGIQQYQATQEEMKSQCEKMKRVVKKRTLAKLRREKLRINPNIDGEGWKAEELEWDRKDGGDAAQGLAGTGNAVQWVALKRLPRTSSLPQRTVPPRPSVS